jgi:hypothetical protein
MPVKRALGALVYQHREGQAGQGARRHDDELLAVRRRKQSLIELVYPCRVERLHPNLRTSTTRDADRRDLLHQREKGLARSGNARVRRGMIRLALSFLEFQT